MSWKLEAFWISQEDWDDSTVSSNTSRMRIQHRLEAMTRRERALAYAFSQQVHLTQHNRKDYDIRDQKFMFELIYLTFAAQGLFQEETNENIGRHGNGHGLELAGEVDGDSGKLHSCQSWQSEIYGQEKVD